MTNAPSLRRRRDFSQILNDALSVYRDARFMPLLLILAIPTLALNFLNLGIEETTPPVLAAVLTFLLTFTVGSLLGTGAIYALDRQDRGEASGVFDSLKAALSRADDLIAAHVRSSLIIVGLMITFVGIPWAFARLVSWTFVSHVIMIDNESSETALDASRDLVAGRGWATFGLLFGTNLVLGIFSGIPQLLVYALLEGISGRVVLAITPVLTFPFQVTGTLLIYYDLKMRKALP